MSNNLYFAARNAEETVHVLQKKSDNWFNQLTTNGYLYKIRDMWAAYHGAYYTSLGSGHQITFGGEQGEMVNFAVNHLRNIADHMIVMINSNRPAMQARAANTDYKSLMQAKLANGLLDYYMREKRLEYYLAQAVRYAVVLSAGYVKMGWNASSGLVYDVNEETDTPIYEGDLEFSNLSPFDIVFDTTKENNNHDWVLCRTYKNKFDLAAKYPELADKINNLSSRTDAYHYRFDVMAYEETDDVPVYEFYHRKSEALPEGRYILYLDKEIVLQDMPLPYDEIPIYRIAPADILGTPYGYTPLFDLLNIQEALNALHSAILTNQSTFAVQNIFVKRNSDINFKALEGGLNIIEGNEKPEPINFTNTPAEVFQYMQKLEKDMETVSGINSVTRGNPEASLRSGTAIAMVHSTALQFISGLQQSYIRLLEDVGTGVINILKNYAQTPRVALIAGKTNRAYVENEFTGNDLAQINRVIVEVSNPLAKTTAGKTQIAESLIQYGVIKTPEQYLSILNTGSLDTLTEGPQNELLLIRAENEKMASGQMVSALAIDQHLTHIKEHRGVLADPDLRSDPVLVNAVLQHIQEHIELLRSTDPNLLAIIGEQPLAPPGGSPVSADTAQSDVNTGQMGEGMAPMGEVPPAAAAAGEPGVPRPAAPMQNSPVTPAENLETLKG